MSSNKIAVIGMSGRFPGAPNLDVFFSNLSCGIDCVKDITAERLISSGLDPNIDYMPYGHLDRIDLFDYVFFRLSKREAENMHPEQRLVLELVLEAMENSGYGYEHFTGTKTAVYLGGNFTTDFAKNITNIEPSIVTGNLNSISAGRISHMFNFSSTSIVVDTACSSSLIAIYEACQKIKSGEADYAIAGGVSLSIDFPKPEDYFIKIGIHSPDGKCKAFAKGADGIGAGEGGGILLLKSLDKAIEDNDIIHAIISGGAVNHDGGRSNGLTAPSPVAQTEVLTQAWSNAGISANDLSYIETHGTGTRLGDPIEIDGIKNAIGSLKEKITIGSVKSNIGHLNAAAGIASVIKCILSLKNKVLFPSLHFDIPNPFIDFEGSSVLVNTEFKEWKTQKNRRICGVSSFGISGTNGHLVLEEYIDRSSPRRNFYGPILLKISGRTLSSLTKLIYKVKESILIDENNLKDLLFTLNTGRADYDYRVCYCADNQEDLVRKISRTLDEGQFLSLKKNTNKKLVLLLGDDDFAKVNDLDLDSSLCSNEIYDYKRTKNIDLTKGQLTAIRQINFYNKLADSGIIVDSTIAYGIGKVAKKVINGELSLYQALEQILTEEMLQKPEIELSKLNSAIDNIGGISNILFLTPNKNNGLANVVQEKFRRSVLISIDDPQIMKWEDFLVNIYIEGGKIKWEKLFPSRLFRRVNAPTYEFDREHCWPYEYANRDSFYKWFYQLKWEKINTIEIQDVPRISDSKVFLLISDKIGLSSEIRKLFPRDKIIEVKYGTEYVNDKNCNFIIDPFSERDQQNMLNEVLASFGKIDSIIYMNDLVDQGEVDELNDEIVHNDFLKIQYTFLKSVSIFFDKGLISIMYLSRNSFSVRNGDFTSNPIIAATVGLYRSVQSDYPQIGVSCLDFGYNYEKGNIAIKIFEEIQCRNRFFLTSFRNDEKYVQKLVAIKDVRDSENDEIKLVSGGVYLITGGATGIGCVLANEIATKINCTIILFGRTNLPDRSFWNEELHKNPNNEISIRIRAIRELEAKGVKVDYYSLDISCEKQMKDVFNSIEMRYKSINTIIHAAGVIPEWVKIPEKEYGIIQRGLSAKIYGALLLRKYYKRYKGVNFIFISSVNSIVPQKYSIEYTAANAFLDSYAEYYSNKGENFVSINWPGWNDTGMVLSGKVKINRNKNEVLKTISSFEARPIFSLILRMNFSNIIVANIDLKRFSNNPFFLVDEQFDISVHEEDGFIKKLPESFSEYDRLIASIWHEVLGVSNLDQNANFFELGGHSLNASQVINRIKERIGVSISWKDFYSCTTLGELANFVYKEENNRRENNELSFVTEESEKFDLSYFQQDIYLADVMEGTISAFNMAVSFRIKGKLDVELLQDCIDYLIFKYDVFRTSIVEDEGIIGQQIHPIDTVSCRIIVKDFTDKSIDKVLLDEYILKLIDEKFDLQIAPLLRVHVIKMSTTESIVLFTMHHIIGDIWSLDILFEEVAKLYVNKKRRDYGIVEKAVYRDFVSLQKLQNVQGNWDKHRRYWNEMFSDRPTVLSLPTDFPRPKEKSIKGSNRSFSIGHDKVNSLKIFSKKNRVSLFSSLLSTVFILLRDYSGMDDITIGIPVSVRDQVNQEKAIGNFVNLVPLRIKIQDDIKLSDFVKSVQFKLIEALEHKAYPYSEIVKDLQLERDASRGLLFDVISTMTNTVVDFSGLNNESSIEIEQYFVDRKVSIFDLNFTFNEFDNDLRVFIDYNPSLYSERKIDRVKENFQNLLNHIIEDSDKLMSNINCVSLLEKKVILTQFSKRGTDTFFPKNLIRRFSEVVEIHKSKIALKATNEQFSYIELDERSNIFANELVEKHNIKKGDVVAVLADSDVNLIVIIIAIMKVGGVFLPLDPKAPISRLDFMIKNSNVEKTVINVKEYEDILKSIDTSIIIYSIPGEPNLKSKLLDIDINNDDIAYIIYTSGSTGEPKAVVVSHGNLTHTIHSSILQFNFNSSLVIPLLASNFFDIFLFEVFNPLLVGGTLLIPDARRLFDVSYIVKLLEKVNAFHAVPALMNEIISVLEEKGLGIVDLKYIFTGGDRVPNTLLNRLLVSLPNAEIYVLYGPTEATIICTSFLVKNNKLSFSSFNVIGKPLPGAEIFILDSSNRILPIGAHGEICISGGGVSQGYLHDNESTQLKFISSPFEEGTTIYKSGDIGMWLENGEIVFLGRRDNQVKIRGFRIEIGEIENCFLKNPDISEVAVVIKKNKKLENYLTAYYVAKQFIEVESLRKYLVSFLPAYMIPEKFYQIDSMPKTRTGKINRNVFFETDNNKSVHSSTFSNVAFENELQEQMLKIWEEILEEENIGLDDSFFSLGGNSLKAMRLVYKMKDQLNAIFSLKDIFSYSTIRQICNVIELSVKEEESIRTKSDSLERYPLSHSQLRIWILQNLNDYKDAYQIRKIVRCKGKIDLENLKRSLQVLLIRHEVLRTKIVLGDNDEPSQMVLPEEHANEFIELDDLSDALIDIEQFIAELKGLEYETSNMMNSRLFNARVFKFSELEYLIIFEFHHIIFDGWSWKVLVDDLFISYNSFISGSNARLSPLSHQFKDYVLLERERIKNGDLENQRYYWKDKLSDFKKFEFPTDFPRLPGNDYKADRITRKISKSKLNKVREFVKDKNGTDFTFLFSALNILFYLRTGAEDIVLGSVVASRSSELFNDTVGFFANTLPIRSCFNSPSSFVEVHDNIKEIIFEAFDNSELPFDLIVKGACLNRESENNPLFNILVVMQENFKNSTSNFGNDVQVEEVEWKNNESKFDLTIEFMAGDDNLFVSIEYSTALYHKSSMDNFLEQFELLIENILVAPDVAIEDLDCISSEERKRLLFDYNDTFTEAEFLSVVEAFSFQVKLSSESLAVVTDEGQLTYEQLDRLSNQLASLLIQRFSINKGDVIGFCIDKGMYVPVIMLGILKVGAIYLPIDPRNPNERLEFIIRESGCSLLIENDNVRNSTIDFIESISISSLVANLSTHTEQLQDIHVLNNETAYIMFTSGTSGPPKGVLIEQKGILRLVGKRNSYNFGRGDNILLTGSLAFDSSTLEIWGALLNGACLHIISYHLLLDVFQLEDRINKWKVNFMWFTSSYFNQVVEENIEIFKRLKCVIIGGDRLSPKHIKLVRKFNPTILLINGYGPTENTTFSSTFIIKDENYINVPIGKPIANTQIYILDKKGKLLPDGAIGEICVSGDGLAQGYLNEPKKTDSPFCSVKLKGLESRTKIYRTGDLGRWMQGGILEFVGRQDFQVKINGYRVQPSEIQYFLNLNDKIDDCIVTIREYEETLCLVAFFTSSEQISVKLIKDHLAIYLPSYFVPNYIIQVDAFRLNSNGKVDYSQLPFPTSRNVYEKQTSEVFSLKYGDELISVWKEVLNLEHINISDNFFDVGGDSLKLIKLHAHLSRRFPNVFKVSDLFSKPTIIGQNQIVQDSIGNHPSENEEIINIII